MAKKPKIPEKLKRGVEARKRHHLSHAQIQMARELGMNPKKFGKLDNHDQERWKLPLGQFIEQCYRKRFGKLPTTVLSIEQQAKQEEKKRAARHEAKTAKRQAKLDEQGAGTMYPWSAAVDLPPDEKPIPNAKSLLDDVPADLPEELFTTILRADYVWVERIVSQGHASPPGFWYDQEENEWVLVLEGCAAVQFEGHAETVELRRGSYLNIPAHARHRVSWTDPAEKTVWLAIHYGSDSF